MPESYAHLQTMTKEPAKFQIYHYKIVRVPNTMYLPSVIKFIKLKKEKKLRKTNPTRKKKKQKKKTKKQELHQVGHYMPLASDKI